MANNANQSKTYRIYLKATKEWVEVPEEFYREQTSYYDTFRKKAQYHGQCICPKSKFWLCDGDCFNCEFRRAGDMLSLDYENENEESKLKGNGKSVPALSVIKTPLRDGDLERPDDAAYANAYFINANATSAPGIVDADLNPIMTRSEVYSGVYGRASITFYAFNSSGNKGIACGLNNLQKVRDGQPLGGKASAESDFATDEDEDFLD